MADEKNSTKPPSTEPEAEEEELPPYDNSNPGESSSAHNQDSKAPLPSPPSGPTVESPFNFPTEVSAPPYSEASSSSAPRKPIAIPQSRPNPAAPFLPAYAPALLSHGITAGSWRSFVTTVSAFLAAKVSDRAIAHAADMAKELSRGTKSFGKGTAEHAKSVGKEIKQQAKEGNFVGAAVGVVGGAISLPIATALRAVGAVVSLPGSAMSAATKRPQTPRERAAAYIAAANKDWFAARGLRAQLLDTNEVADLVGLETNALLALSRAAKDAPGKLSSMQSHFAGLELPISEPLDLAVATLWLVVTEEGVSVSRNAAQRG